MDPGELFEVRLSNGDRFYVKGDQADIILGGRPVGEGPIPAHFVSVQAFDAPAGKQPVTATGFIWINPAQVVDILRLATTRAPAQG